MIAQKKSVRTTLPLLGSKIAPKRTPKRNLIGSVENEEEKGATILSHRSYKNGLGYHVIGEVKNAGTKNLCMVEITARFYDELNAPLGLGFCYSSIRVLKPTEKSPFHVIFFSAESNARSYKLSVRSSTTRQEPYGGLKILEHTSHKDRLGYFYVIGKVKNLGNKDAGSVSVIGTFYDSAGRVLAVDSTYAYPQQLSPGEVGKFALSVGDKIAISKINRYAVNVWSPQGLYITSPKWI